MNWLSKALELSAQITDPVTAASFAAVLALIALIGLSKGKKKPPPAAWGLSIIILILGISPLAARTYLDSLGIYRIRIEVVGPNRLQAHEADVTSSAGGELKKTDAGWEFSIPPQGRPLDGIVTFRATEPDAFLAGSTALTLSQDYYPEVAIELKALPPSFARGMVEDENGRPIEGARVWVQGYDENATTTATGSFSVLAHAAEGQQITILAQKEDKIGQTTAFAGKIAEVILGKTSKHR